MSVSILDASAWREFRGTPESLGVNKTVHLAKIADQDGKVHDCFVKLLPQHPSLLAEAIGWLLTRASGISCVPFAAIVLVPLDHLRKCINLPPELADMKVCPAWCSEIVNGKSVRQVHRWAFWLSRLRCLQSKDARDIAAFDIWTDLKDRNFGNVVRSPSGGYISIDHETILHDLLCLPVGVRYELRSLYQQAKQHLPAADFKRFQMDMAKASELHAQGVAAARSDIADTILKICPTLAPTLTSEILEFLEIRAREGWMANALGVIA